MATLFFSYSHADEALRNELEKHLSMLKREGAITAWHDRRISAGDPVDRTISEWLEKSDVILLIISADFLSSEYCYGIEMKRAMERHADGSARVLPVILRPCDWHTAPFGKLLATPKDGKPVTRWPNQDEAFLDVVKAIRAALTKPATAGATTPPQSKSTSTESNLFDGGPRSSNLRVRKKFSDRDKDTFLDKSFDYIAQYFENSLRELHARNPEIDGSFKRDGRRFDAAVYREGKALSRCAVRLGGHGFGVSSGITLSYGLNIIDNSFNESLSIVEGEHTLALRSLGMTMRAPHGDQLSQQGAAEYYWSIFIEPLQRQR